MKQPLLSITGLGAEISGRKIISGITLAIPAGELHVLMGPNGSGKSTLAKALMGAPGVRVTRGSARLAGKNLLRLAPDARARAGLFLSFQHPVGIPGLSLSHLLTAALRERGVGESKVTEEQLPQILARFKLPSNIAYRDVNEGLSGGEKKKSEIAQLVLLKPKLAILDEPDSGLDVDALKSLAEVIDDFHQQGMTILLITHYSRILRFLRADAVHVMVSGKIVKSGGPKLAGEIELRGYEPLVRET